MEIRKIISAVLILITAYLSFKHAWSGLSGNVKPAEAKMFADIGITPAMAKGMGILLVLVGVMVLFPQTFLIANLINGASIIIIMFLALKSGNGRIALMEIPFLLMPMLMIWLGHPLKK
jgi:hypothetical protein